MRTYLAVVGIPLWVLTLGGFEGAGSLLQARSGWHSALGFDARLMDQPSLNPLPLAVVGIPLWVLTERRIYPSMSPRSPRSGWHSALGFDADCCCPKDLPL